MTEAEIQAERESRREFRASLIDHPGVLAWIGNELGIFSTDPALIDPLLIAFWNRLLFKCGIVHVENLFDYVQALAQTSNDRDLVAAEKELEKEVL